MSYQNKYLKYKTKYLNLKTLIGGSITDTLKEKKTTGNEVIHTLAEERNTRIPHYDEADETLDTTNYNIKILNTLKDCNHLTIKLYNYLGNLLQHEHDHSKILKIKLKSRLIPEITKYYNQIQNENCKKNLKDAIKILLEITNNLNLDSIDNVTEFVKFLRIFIIHEK